MRLRLPVLAALLLSSPALAACPPGFSDFPTRAWAAGKAAPILDTPHKRNFRTMIRIGAQEGDPFGDRYRLAVWGCGTACQQAALVDTRSGRVVPAPDGILGYDLRPGSRLLVVSPLDAGSRETLEERRKSGYPLPSYYVLEGGRFVPLCGGR